MHGGSLWRSSYERIVYEMLTRSNVLCTLRGDIWHAAVESICALKEVRGVLALSKARSSSPPPFLEESYPALRERGVLCI